jgi:hypothetical protein
MECALFSEVGCRQPHPGTKWEATMSNLPSSDSSIDGHGKDNRGYQILLQLLRGEAGQGNAFMARGDIDTYKGLVQLRELLRGG